MASNLSKFMESFERNQQQGKHEGDDNSAVSSFEQSSTQEVSDVSEQPNKVNGSKSPETQHQQPKMKIKLTPKIRKVEATPTEPQQDQSLEDRRNRLKAMQEAQRRRQQQTTVDDGQLQMSQGVPGIATDETPRRRGPKPKVEVKQGTVHDEAVIERLFTESETNPKFHDAWVTLYRKAFASDKQTMTNAKIRNGRFRLDETGKLEILSDFPTYGKTSKDLMSQTWKL